MLRSEGVADGQYLSGKKAIPVPTNRRMNRPSRSGEQRQPPSGAWLTVKGARQNNLQNIDVAFPLGAFVAVTGVSGSGKSSLVNEVLYQTLARRLHRARTAAAAHDDILGLEHIDKVINVDQDPIGNSPSSNPATYTGVFDLIRQLFAQLARVEGARLPAAALQLQQAGRPLRGVRGQRPEEDRDALPARRLGRVRRLPRASATTPRRWRSATRASRSPTC